MARGVALTSNLPQLQRLIKSDHGAYREEFLQQWNHYNSIRHLFNADPAANGERFRELVSFVSQVAKYYPKETAEFPSHLSSILLDKYECICPDTRTNIVRNLVILRKKDIISPLQLLNFLFPLLSIAISNNLRSLIQTSIITDIRYANKTVRHHKLNGAFQAMLFGLLDRGTISYSSRANSAIPTAGIVVGNDVNVDAAMWAVMTTKELWQRGIWTEPKAISILATGCFHFSPKVQSASIHFFLGEDQAQTCDEPTADNNMTIKKLYHRQQVNKKTRSKAKRLDQKLKSLSRKRTPCIASRVRFPALQLLHDPQTFAERLYENLLHHDKKFTLDHRILVMRLLSLVIGTHRLCVLGFYTYVLKYLTVRQLRVSAILAVVAQSIHSWTPPDIVSPVIRKLAQEFIHPGVGSEVVTAGLNCIREVCKRQPCCMEPDLLSDLVEYKKSKDKGVSMSARGLQQLYRSVDPGMLKKGERGKPATIRSSRTLSFGHFEEDAIEIDGLSLLEDHIRKVHNHEHTDAASSADNEGWQDWEVESDTSSDSGSGGWIDVVSDGAESLILSDSESTGFNREGEKKESADHDEPDVSPVSMLATTKILTPADFQLLNELRIQAARTAVEAGGGFRAKRKLAALQTAKISSSRQDSQPQEAIAEDDILGPRKKTRADYSTRVASSARGREGREKKYSSPRKERDTPKSSTNKEKSRKKPLMMILASGVVRGKKKSSLREKQIKLKKRNSRSRK